MKHLKTLAALSAVIALSSLSVNADTKVIDLAEHGVPGKDELTTTGEADCLKDSCAKAIAALENNPSIKQQAEQCNTTEACNVSLDVPECGSCHVQIEVANKK